MEESVFRDTRTGGAMLEIAEDRLKELVRHYQDFSVSGKASKITITITVEPNESRDRLSLSVAGTSTLSARKAVHAELFAGIGTNDEVVLREFDPKQLSLSDF